MKIAEFLPLKECQFTSFVSLSKLLTSFTVFVKGAKSIIIFHLFPIWKFLALLTDTGW